MALHKQIAVAADVKIYFADPHSPWQRPSNENTNGLLRQYFPKGSDLSKVPAGRLAEVAGQLNGRPRKVLGWKTPGRGDGRVPGQPGRLTGRKTRRRPPPPLITGRVPRIVRGRPSGLKAAPHRCAAACSRPLTPEPPQPLDGRNPRARPRPAPRLRTPPGTGRQSVW